MFSSWFDVTMLAMESSSVVCLRMMKVSAGGCDVHQETQLMVSEKISASMEAAMTLMTGGTLDTVVNRYREHVAANSDRLLGTAI